MGGSPSGSVVIHCPQCHWNLGIALADLAEVASGAWGTIKCGRCGDRLNDLIIKEREKIEPTPFGEEFSLHPGEHPPEDFPEDFIRGSNCYMCRCVHCNKLFRGDKRRTVCRLCVKHRHPEIDKRSAPHEQ